MKNLKRKKKKWKPFLTIKKITRSQQYKETALGTKKRRQPTATINKPVKKPRATRSQTSVASTSTPVASTSTTSTKPPRKVILKKRDINAKRVMKSVDISTPTVMADNIPDYEVNIGNNWWVRVEYFSPTNKSYICLRNMKDGAKGYGVNLPIELAGKLLEGFKMANEHIKESTRPRPTHKN